MTYMMYVRAGDPDCPAGMTATRTTRPPATGASHWELGSRAYYHNDATYHDWTGPMYDDNYENDECPEHCNDDHDCPTVESFTCPVTDVEYAWCESCYEFQPVHHVTSNGYAYRSYYYIGLDGEQRCEDCHDDTFTYCDGCEADMWRDDMAGCNDYGEQFCSECWSERGDGMSSEPRRPHAAHRARCGHCGTYRDHFDLLTESLYCDCDAHANILAGRPIVLARPMLRLPGVVTDDMGNEVDSVRLVEVAA